MNQFYTVLMIMRIH